LKKLARSDKTTIKIKKKNMRHILFTTMALITLSSCEKDVTNIKLPPSIPKLVVGCFISPQDSIITLNITRSNPIFGSGHDNTNNYSKAVEDASVVISNETSSKPIPFNVKTFQYELPVNSFQIIPGITYTLTASTPKGESISASCTVPASNLTSFSTEFTNTSSSMKKLKVTWNDIPKEINYYRVYGETIFHSATTDTIFQSMYGDNFLFDDKEKDGLQFYSNLSSYFYYNSIYDIYVLNIDEEYYKYQYSRNHYTSSDPFSEPSTIYTNIKGGLGIFAAYQKLKIRY
jgi:hypothetical protein